MPLTENPANCNPSEYIIIPLGLAAHLLHFQTSRTYCILFKRLSAIVKVPTPYELQCTVSGCCRCSYTSLPSSSAGRFHAHFIQTLHRLPAPLPKAAISRAPLSFLFHRMLLSWLFQPLIRLVKRIHLKTSPPGFRLERWQQGSTNAVFGSKMGFQSWRRTLLSHSEQL